MVGRTTPDGKLVDLDGPPDEQAPSGGTTDGYTTPDGQYVAGSAPDPSAVSRVAVNLLGERTDADGLPINGGAPGDAWLIDGRIWLWSDGTWIDIGALMGPKGDPNTLTVGSVTASDPGDAADASITGEAPDQTLNLVIPRGIQGTQGVTGNTGNPGPGNTLAIGAVAEGEAAATITGASPSQTLNLVVPRGNTGAPGPANSLSIGTVAQGPAAATMTGTSPSQTLNLTVPKGDQGIPGPANSLGIGTVAEGTAAATITGTAPAQTLSLVVPRGNTGATGPANSLAIGPVATGAPGSSAAATITGAAPSQTLSLTIPRGDTGSSTGGANLTTSQTSTSVTVNSDTGTDAIIAAADTTNAGVMTAADRTRLTGIATGATANQTDAYLLARANHTGTQSADTLTDGTTNKAFLATERTKLAGIATGADVTASGNVGTVVSGATAKTTPVDADTVPLTDSAASNALRKVSWANVKVTLKSYFDTVYAAVSHTHAGSAITSGTVAPARLGSGTTDATTVLYGDGTWQTAASGTAGQNVLKVTEFDASVWTNPTILDFREGINAYNGGDHKVNVQVVYGGNGSSNSASRSDHTHAGSGITSGTVAPVRLGSGTASSTTVLYGDSVWRAASGGGSTVLEYAYAGPTTVATTATQNVWVEAGTLAISLPTGAYTLVIVGTVTISQAASGRPIAARVSLDGVIQNTRTISPTVTNGAEPVSFALTLTSVAAGAHTILYEYSNQFSSPYVVTGHDVVTTARAYKTA